MTTHLQYIKQIASLASANLSADERSKIDAQITYSMGKPGLRGVTYYGAWQNGSPNPVPFVEVCAAGEENDVQLAGTTIHELAHVLAGHTAGHGKDWKAACRTLGLRCPKAAGTVYRMAQFAPALRNQIAQLISPSDGKPVGMIGRHQIGTVKPKPCPLGTGTRGGKSRGKGSGSRLRRYVCGCNPPVIVRVSRDNFHAHCDICTEAFRQ